MKNILIVVLMVTSAVAIVFGFLQKKEAERQASQLIECGVQTKDLEGKVHELQKMYEVATVEAQVQRTICEEQLKDLKNK